MTVVKFLKSSSVSTSTGSDLLTFSVKNSDPETAKSLATAYARAFTRYRRDLDSQEFQRAYTAVQLQLTKLRASGLEGSDAYENLVQKERELTALQALRSPTAVIVQEADRAENVGEQTIRNGMLGLVLGIVLGLGLAFLVEALDTRVRSVDAIRDRLGGLRLLGSLPAPPHILEEDDRLVMVAAPMSYEAEPFRVLRATLDFANADLRAQTIMVTSALDGEGKTTTVANLAVALARAGRRVALIDFDLRRPRLHRVFDLNERPGLVDVELGNVRLQDALQEVPIIFEPGWTIEDGSQPTRSEGKLEVLSAGHMLLDPDELGVQSAMAKIVQGLQDHADVVLIDAAPLLPVSDSITLSAHVDGLILVVRLNALRSRGFDDVQQILSASPAAKLGFVLTGAEFGEGYQHYRYSSSHVSDTRHAREPAESPEARAPVPEPSHAPSVAHPFSQDRAHAQRTPSRWRPSDDAVSE